MSRALLLNQLAQLENPDGRIVLAITSASPLLKRVAESRYGLRTGDGTRFILKFWEMATLDAKWRFHQSSTTDTVPFGGREHILLWENNDGALAAYFENGIASMQGMEAWQKPGVTVSLMRELPVTSYTGESFDNNCCAIWCHSFDHLPAVFTFCSSDDFPRAVRILDQKLNVTNQTLLKVPFDLEHWQKVADERYPDGLPEPHSDDPTQWLFRGDIPSSTDALQVAIARLLGYRWPDQSEGPLDQYADEDGIVTLAPLVNQDGIAGRLRALLQAAYESEAPKRPKGAPEPKEPRTWNEAVIPNLLSKAGSSGMGLEEWLRDRFFDAHCKLFQQRPFIWHVWDGRKDGFHAFVNYHKLDRKDLERLTHVYLGEWIERQRAAADAGDRTADARLIAAQELQRKLELIRTGEPPFDLFVRWKSLAEQPMGWDPDLNDGVRMNIRPFVEAGVLRGKVNVNWNKDRGRDPKPNLSGTDERHNDLHFTLAEKRAAREAQR
jgi:hypothetical protein